MKLFNAQVQDQVRGQTESVAIEGQALKASNSVRDQFSSLQSSSNQPESESKHSSSVQFKTTIPVSSNIQSSHSTFAVARSSVDIDNSLSDRINSLLRKEILHRDIFEEMESTGKNELIQGQEKYRIQKKLLMIYVTGDPEDVQY